MSRFVIDASAATEYLLRTPLGLKLVDILEDATLLAPELLAVEVMSVLRRAVLRGELSDQRALLALDDLTDWGVDRIPHLPLLRVAWQHSNNISAYDAFYLAAARLADATLLTTDGPLSRAPSLGIAVVTWLERQAPCRGNAPYTLNRAINSSSGSAPRPGP